MPGISKSQHLAKPPTDTHRLVVSLAPATTLDPVLHFSSDLDDWERTPDTGEARDTDRWNTDATHWSADLWQPGPTTGVDPETTWVDVIVATGQATRQET